MRLYNDKLGYNYICTHADGFNFVAKDLGMWIDCISSTFFIKEPGPRSYYLGNDYTYHEEHDMWTYSVKTYAIKAVTHVEHIFGCILKEATPLPVKDCHPEMDESPLLDLDDHKNSRCFWACSNGLSPLDTKISAIWSLPWTALVLVLVSITWILHLENLVISNGIQAQRLPLTHIQWTTVALILIIRSFSLMDPSFLDPFGLALQASIIVDSDHGYEKKTQCSLTGLLAFIGSTPILWL